MNQTYKGQIIVGGCVLPSDRGITIWDNVNASRAQEGSRMLLEAMLRYGARHGLPNIDPETCAWRLRRLAA